MSNYALVWRKVFFRLQISLIEAYTHRRLMKNILFPVAQLADDLRCLTKRKTFILIRINYPEDGSGVPVTVITKININTVTIIVRKDH